MKVMRMHAVEKRMYNRSRWDLKNRPGHVLHRLLDCKRRRNRVSLGRAGDEERETDLRDRRGLLRNRRGQRRLVRIAMSLRVCHHAPGCLHLYVWRRAELCQPRTTMRKKEETHSLSLLDDPAHTGLSDSPCRSQHLDQLLIDMQEGRRAVDARPPKICTARSTTSWMTRVA